MVIIFILLGLGFIGGGVALIVDGWPYMVLERGFTQVIAGTVVASTGVVLLGLARVLSELGRVRLTLSNAVMAASLASMATREEPALSEAFALEPAPRRDAAGSPAPTAAGMALGGLAAAGLAGTALARAGAEDTAVAGAEGPAEADLFGVVAPAVIEPDASETEAETAGEPADAAQLPFDDAIWLDRELAKELSMRSLDGEAQPSKPDDAAGASPSDDEPVAGERRSDERDADSAASGNEFDFLRESLAHLRPGRDDLARPRTDDGSMLDAAAWMSPRREEAVVEPVLPTVEPDRRAVEPDPAREDTWAPPAWPPLTQAAAEPDHAPAADEIAEPLAMSAESQESEPVAPADGEQRPAPPEAITEAAPQPAASDEGVIGAYQVGDAQFTLYADGSIQAKTPDGDYRFESMDELKTYLASEKSRLGM